MNTKWFTNPLWLYGWIWGFVFFIYSLKWSDYYSNLSLNLGIFLTITSIISFLSGITLEIKSKNKFLPIPISPYNKTMLWMLWAGYIIEFFYSGGVPLLMVLSGSFGSYTDFTGIPTFHVILATFNIFFSVYLFHQYLSSGRKKHILLIFIIAILPNILVLNRGAIMVTIISCLVMHLMEIKKINIKKIIKIALGAIVVLFLFGQLGNVRNTLSQDNKEYILKLGGASEDFINGSVPFEYYWGYLYIASPIGNLQNIVNSYDKVFDINNLVYFGVYETMPDFISKRLSWALGLKESSDISRYLVVESLNAPTVYFRSYYILGWIGMYLMFLFSTGVIVVYLFLMRSSGLYYITGIALLSSIVVLNTFSNMWSASGTILIWPLLLTMLNKIKFNKCLKK